MAPLNPDPGPFLLRQEPYNEITVSIGRHPKVQICVMQTTDYSARGGSQYNGGMTSQVASALAAARNLDRSQHGPGDASIRYGRAHFAPSQEGFAQQFGPYAGTVHAPPACAACSCDRRWMHAKPPVSSQGLSWPSLLALASAVCPAQGCLHL